MVAVSRPIHARRHREILGGGAVIKDRVEGCWKLVEITQVRWIRLFMGEIA